MVMARGEADGRADSGRRALTCLTGLLLALQAGVAMALPGEVVLLRHGHKDRQRGDFNLSPIGLVRMEALARVIPACLGAIDRIIVYPFDRVSGKNSRSYQSAVPLAVATGLPITIAESAPEHSEQVGRALLTDPALTGARVVLIWEHRRLPDLARGLGWTTMPPIADDDFDHLDRLLYGGSSTSPTVVRESQTVLLASACARKAAASALPDQPDPARGVHLDVAAWMWPPSNS